MSLRTTNTIPKSLDLEDIMNDDYGTPDNKDTNINKYLEKILEEGTGFSKYGGDKKFNSSLKFNPKISFPADKETQEILDESDRIYKSSSIIDKENKEFLKELIEEGNNENQQQIVEIHHEALNMGIYK